MMGWGYYNMMGGWLWVMLVPLILVGAIIYAVAKLSNKGSYIRNERAYDSSLEILNERFAKGEINEEEYRRKKELLINR